MRDDDELPVTARLRDAPDLALHTTDEELLLHRIEQGLRRDHELPPRIARFTVLQELGHGGMGSVVAAYDPRLDRSVAIKRVRVGTGSRARERLLTEAIMMAKLNLIPIRKGYWGNKIGATHTVPCKVTGKSGSVKVRLIPAPRGAGLVAPPVSKKLFQFAGLQDVYTKTEGTTRTRGNFIKAAYAALARTFTYNSPDFWGKSVISDHPFIVFQKELETLKKE